MEINKILQADLLDILFDGKNKEYGAYELRKTYSRRISTALLYTVLICVALVAFSYIPNMKPKEEAIQMFVQDVTLEDLKQEEKKQELPPPPPIQEEPPKVEITKFTPPVIVKDNEVKEDDEIKEVAKLEDTKIGTINQEGVKDEGFVITAVGDGKGTGLVEGPKVEKEDYDRVFTSVQIPAEFPGGLEAWNRYLERNLNRDLPVDNGAPPGRYIVSVTFIVDKEGRVSEVKAENNPGYGTADEAVRVIQKGPNWKPALQNGRNVIYRNKQNIIFMVVRDDER